VKRPRLWLVPNTETHDGLRPLIRENVERSLPCDWQLVQPREHDSYRWECENGRWITLSIGKETELWKIALADSSGRRVLIDSVEGALDLAKSWRT
jgi:hypothetical protein